MMEADTFGDDRISVSNAEHNRWSVVRISGDQGPGALLQVRDHLVHASADMQSSLSVPAPHGSSLASHMMNGAGDSSCMGNSIHYEAHRPTHCRASCHWPSSMHLCAYLQALKMQYPAACHCVGVTGKGHPIMRLSACRLPQQCLALVFLSTRQSSRYCL